jgi:hypothetical protein
MYRCCGWTRICIFPGQVWRAAEFFPPADGCPGLSIDRRCLWARDCGCCRGWLDSRRSRNLHSLSIGSRRSARVQPALRFRRWGLVPRGQRSNDGFHTEESGTYTVNSDYTGSAKIKFPPPGAGLSGAVIEVMFVLSNHGRTIHQTVRSLTPPGPTGDRVAVPASIHADGEKLGPVPEDRGEKHQ